jgi:hypothetical protein
MSQYLVRDGRGFLMFFNYGATLANPSPFPKGIKEHISNDSLAAIF